MIGRISSVRSGRLVVSVEELAVANSSRALNVFALGCGIVGLLFRTYGLNGSLWLDEFGTLWVVEGTFSELVRRVHTFQGQSMFYYSLTWIFVRLFGESELVLRIVPLILGVGTTYGIYMVGSSLWGKNAGLLAASFFWIAPAIVQASTDARPYMLALLMAVLMFYGFARAAQDGGRFGRCLFILGGVGLFSAHYILALSAVGIAVGYVVFPQLRSNYPIRSFTLDVSLQLLFVAWSLPQLFGLWVRRENLVWFESKNYLTFFELLAPFLVLILAPYLAKQRPLSTKYHRALAVVFASAVAAQIFILHIVAFFGTNLLHVRYMIVILVPAVLLASPAFLVLPHYLRPVSVGYWLVSVSLFFLVNFNAYGSFSGAGFQNWRQAVSCLDGFVRSEPEAVVLFRSGFVEEDQLIRGRETPATLAPLRSPGHQPVSWPLVQLTYSWNKAGRDAYFARTVEPVFRGASVVYFLSCAGCYNELTGQYPDALIAWVESKFPRQFHAEFINAGRGITLVQFSHAASTKVAVLSRNDTERSIFKIGCV